MTRPARLPSPALRLSVQFADPTHRALLPRALLLRWIRAALRVGPQTCEPQSSNGEARPHQITLRFVTADEGQALNRDYRGKDYATNVLTFDYGHWPVLADIVLCSPVVAREAQAQDKPLVAHYAHLVIHGVLHAQGWDHLTEREAQEMERHEVAALQRFAIPDPYADGSTLPAG
ncbi:rRNA maturation RNase YbeY [Thiomonas intermedia]|uniref:rRNA maturation RNase YbeY n=1 Tax=Thiomonas intermedia TaxID=926 RepID=UPI0009A4AA9E|nr:rRNA maturation RNase YbeY [Thiomonas intermedia]